MSAANNSTQAWQALVATLERLLYDHDPDGMGASVSAPLDEYHDVAVSVVRSLRDRTSSQSIEQAVREVVPGASANLLRDITTAWSAHETQDEEA